MSAQTVSRSSVIIKKATTRSTRGSWHSSIRQPAFHGSRPKAVSAPARKSVPMELAVNKPTGDLSERFLAAVALVFMAAVVMGVCVIGVQFFLISSPEVGQNVSDLAVAVAQK